MIYDRFCTVYPRAAVNAEKDALLHDGVDYYYAEREVYASRYYAAKQAGVQLTRMICLPRVECDARIVADQYVVTDDGQLYRIEQAQYGYDDNGLPITTLSLAEPEAVALDKQITIIRRARVYDADGDYIVADTVILTCAAEFSRTSGTEVQRRNADFAEVKVRFLIEYAPGLDRKMLVQYAGQDYQIEYVDSFDDAGHYLALYCSLLTQDAGI